MVGEGAMHFRKLYIQEWLDLNIENVKFELILENHLCKFLNSY